MRALRFCSECGHWVDALTEHDCPRKLQLILRASRSRLEGWLGDFSIYQHEYD